jgi:hypothetical protein
MAQFVLGTLYINILLLLVHLSASLTYPYPTRASSRLDK